jgi:peptidoglycan lytic transglycosylase G
LPPQPPLPGLTKGALRPNPLFSGSPRGAGGLNPLPSGPISSSIKPDSSRRDSSRLVSSKPDPSKPDPPKSDPSKSDPSKFDPFKSDPFKSDSSNSDLAKLGFLKPDFLNLAMPERQRSSKVSVAPAAPGPPMPSSGTPQPSAPARLVIGAGEPEPPMAGRPDGPAASQTEQKRITPRSPRAALEPDHVPLPTRSSRPSRRARNPLVIVGNAIFTLLLLVLLVGGGIAVFGKSRFETPGPLEEDKVVNIPPRSGMMDIADLLKREGVIDEHRLVFIGGVFALKARSELKAGEYLFSKHASVREVVETIVEGKVVQHQLTIPEGLTSEQIVARLLESDILSGNVKDVPREGSLLPDGYHFNRGFTREQMIQRMRQAQDRLVREAWERRNPDLPLKTPDQLVILASIIEKETGKPEERTRVAAVFANRLKQKMKLQSDPTIIYGLVFGKGTLGHPLTKSEIAQPTPYNTYVIDGLPPGPIANPGRGSIEAAANPARTKELFFVADGTGGHAFAETYDQHLKNVARLRALESEQRGEASAPDVQAPAPGRATPAPTQRGRRSANGSSRAAGAAQ